MDGSVALRSARQRARLTQEQLASRAGVTQSVISAYESGRRQPSVPTLAALISATDFELDLQLRSSPRRLAPLTGPIGRRVRRHRRHLLDISAEHGIHGLRVFGSVARGDDGPDSDLDLLAVLPTGMGLIGLGRARDDLEAVIGCSVDLVPVTDLKAGVRENVEAEAIALWTIVTGGGSPTSPLIFDTNHAIVQATVTHDLPELRDAVARLLE